MVVGGNLRRAGPGQLAQHPLSGKLAATAAPTGVTSPSEAGTKKTKAAVIAAAEKPCLKILVFMSFIWLQSIQLNRRLV